MLNWIAKRLDGFEISWNIIITPRDTNIWLEEQGQSDIVVGSDYRDVLFSSVGTDILLGRGGPDLFVITLPEHSEVNDDPQITFVSGGEGYDVFHLSTPPGDEYTTLVDEHRKYTTIAVMDLDDGHAARLIYVRGVEFFTI